MGLFGARRFPNIDPQLGGMIAQERGGFGAPMQMPQQQAPERRPGLGTRLLGQGWEGKVSALGGLLMGDGNAVSNFHAQQQQAQQLAMRAQQEEMQRQRARMERREDTQWEWQNKPAPQNDTERDVELIRQQLGDEAAAAFLRNKANPPQYRVGPDGQFYRVDVAEPQVIGSTLPQGWQIEGGPGGSPSGAGFPNR